MADKGNSSRVICVSQARMTSTRLPGKVLREVLGRPLLYYHLSRLQRARHIDRLVVATTVNATDDPIEEFCDRMGVAVFRGDEQDVLSRYVGAVEAFGEGAETVVRVTSDCPLIDPGIVDAAIELYCEGQPELDYMAVDNSRYPRGLDAEVFRRSALMAAAREGVAGAEREHVTPFIYRRPERFNCAKYPAPGDFGHHRWCVDEPADFELIGRMIEALVPEKPEFNWHDCLAVLAENPEWAEINAGVEQKHLSRARSALAEDPPGEIAEAGDAVPEEAVIDQFEVGEIIHPEAAEIALEQEALKAAVVFGVGVG